MDDIEKRIELKNLEIKKLRLEQELSNLSNDSYQEPQTTQNTQKATSPPNNTYNKPNNVKKNRLRFLYFALFIASAIGAVIILKDHILLRYDKAVIADIQGTWSIDEVRDDDLMEHTIHIYGSKYEAWAKQLSLDKKTVIRESEKESGTFSLDSSVYEPNKNDFRRNINFIRNGYKYNPEVFGGEHLRGIYFLYVTRVKLGNRLIYGEGKKNELTKVDEK